MFAGGYAQGEESGVTCIARPFLFIKEDEPTPGEIELYQQLLNEWREMLEAARNRDTFSFRYYNQDHLGNNREVVDEAGNILQVTNYYPFGTPYCDAVSTINPDIQPFKYNGKELDMMHGMDTYDYGARQYSSILSTWDRVDPMAEKYYHTSPYVYCMNNPVNAIDTDGKKVYLFATTLPYDENNPILDNIQAPTHTFLVVNDVYFAYGPADDGHLKRINYDKDKYEIQNGTLSDGRLKAKILIEPPTGMSESEFDKKVIEVANSFGDNKSFKYDLFALSSTTGNCNSSSSTILYKSGVSKEQINRLRVLLEKCKANGQWINSIVTGFGDIKAWTKKEQEDVLNKQYLEINELYKKLLGSGL